MSNFEEFSYVMIKPTYLNHKDEIKSRLEAIGGSILEEKTLKMNKDKLKEHYAHIADKPFYPEVEEYMLSGDCYAMLVAGSNGIIAKIREIVGPTKNSPKGTIRGDFMHENANSSENVIHASDARDTANAEIERFFGSEIFNQYHNN